MNSERWAVAYRNGMTSPPYELDLMADNDSDWVDDLTQEDEDSAGEDSVSVDTFVRLKCSIKETQLYICTKRCMSKFSFYNVF